MPRQVAQYRGQAARTVAELLARGGEAQAQAALISGDAWGRGIANAGQAIAGGLQQYGQIKEQEKAQKQSEEQAAQRDAIMAGLTRAKGQMEPGQWAARALQELGPDMGEKYIKGIFGAESAALEAQQLQQSLQTGEMDLAERSRAGFRSSLGDVYDLVDAMGGPTNPLAAKVLQDEILPMASTVFGEQLTLDQIAEPGTWKGLGQYLRGPQEEKVDSRGIEARLADAAEAGDVEAMGRLLSAKGQLSEAGRAPMDALERRLQVLDLEKKELEIAAARKSLEGGGSPVKLGAAALDRVSGADQGIAIASNLEKLLDEDWLGPVMGRATEAGVSLPGVPVSEELAEFYADTATLKNATVKAITGAQMSEPEAARIMKQIPTFADKPVVWKKKLQQTVENLRMMRQRIVSLSGGDVSDPNAGYSPGQASPSALPQDGGGYQVGMVVEDESGNQFQWTGSGWIAR